GSGGSGKTRLALQVAADAVDRFPDGAWLVELASVSEPAQVAQTVASVVGIREGGGRSLDGTLAAALASKRLVLLLDTGERVVAAARVNVLSPHQILSRLDDQYRLLTGGSRTAVPRQRTLRAAVDWSHQLMGKDDQVLLRRLAVFAGGWTLAAAERVAADDTLDERDVLDVLDRLVARSLVFVEEQDGAARYRLLDSIRQYAQEKLVEAGEVVELRRRHLEAFADFVRRAEAELTGPDQAAWLARLATEPDNVRAAMD